MTSTLSEDEIASQGIRKSDDCIIVCSVEYRVSGNEMFVGPLGELSGKQLSQLTLF